MYLKWRMHFYDVLDLCLLICTAHFWLKFEHFEIAINQSFSWNDFTPQICCFCFLSLFTVFPHLLQPQLESPLWVMFEVLAKAQYVCRHWTAVLIQCNTVDKLAHLLWYCVGSTQCEQGSLNWVLFEDNRPDNCQHFGLTINVIRLHCSDCTVSQNCVLGCAVAISLQERPAVSHVL